MMGSVVRRRIAIIKDPKHFSRVAESVQILNERQDFMDVCFVCAQGQRVFAHKLLLCAVSTQLKEIFLENPDKTDIITVFLPDIDARLLRMMFVFLYEGGLHLDRSDYEELKNLMTLLGVVLKSRSERPCQPQPDVPPSSQSQPPPQSQPAPLVYMQAHGPNNQGQVQYVLASPTMMSQGQMVQVATPTSSLPQGQMMQVATPTNSLPQGQMMQVATPTNTLPQGQMMQVATPTASLPQGQMIQMAPTIMSQANGQMMMHMAQAGASGQVMQVPVPTSSLPQGQMIQMTPTIMSQASSQISVQSGCTQVQGSQVVTTPMQQNNMMQVVPQSNAQVQQPDQRSQYVMASTANQMTTSRARAQYTQPQQQIAARSRTTTQTVQPTRTNAVMNNVAGSSTKEDILSILQENCNNIEAIETLTARHLREILEPKLGVDLSKQEELIEEVLKSFQKGSGKNVSDDKRDGTSENNSNTRRRSRAWIPDSNQIKLTQRRKKRVNYSDDEDDEDFDPKRGRRRSKRR